MIECASCSHVNPDDSRFCESCGTALHVACPGCSEPNSPGAQFCRSCGYSLKSDEKTTVAGGRYELRKFLGEGARKRIYLAYDRSLDREVAIARIKMEGLDESGRTRVQRETQAMARLGDHPNIVTIHDVFEEDKSLFIVSQFMAGGDIADLLNRSEGRRLPPERVLEVSKQVAAALAHAHSRGVVHRDLKPANVWLTTDGVAKLGDFGLAVALDQTRLTTEGLMVGTVDYIPPEQALGKPPEERSDLYSLGAMMYEMVTGRPPFLGDDSVAIISQHLTTAPVGPSWHYPEIAPAIEALILQLLEKEPDKRPASANDVLKKIGTILARPSELVERVELDQVNPLDQLASGLFVGREEVMAELKQYVDESLLGRPRLLMLVGEPGIGKTRTAEEASTYGRLKGAQVLVGRCHEGEGAPSYWPWIQLIRSYIHDRPDDAIATEMGQGAANIAQIVAEVRERFPGLPEPAALEPEQARFQLFDSITSFLRNASNHRPLVLVLDDLHWTDKASLMLLQFLARELHQSRILAIGTYRDVELGRHHPLAQTLSQLAQANTIRRIPLRGLGSDDVERFIELSSGIAPDPALVKAVHQETEGNPFFVEETVRLLVSEGRLRESPSSWSLTIPQSVREVVGRRLDRLSEASNEILSVASVVGREFALTVLERAGAHDRAEVLEALEAGQEARVIEETEGVGRYRFSHALIREVLYEDLTTTRRIRLHQSVGQVLESLYAKESERHLNELAHHFFEAAVAGDAPKAVEYNRRAGGRAVALTAYEEAVQLYDRAMQAYDLIQPRDETLLCDLLIERGLAETSAGDTIGARNSLVRAAEIADAVDDPQRLGRAALAAGDVWVSAGWAERELISLTESALSRLPDEDSPLRAQLTGRLGEALRLTDRFPEERELTTKAMEMAQRLDDPTTIAKTLFWSFVSSGRPEDRESRKTLAYELIEVARRHGDQPNELLGLRSAVMTELESGDLEGARRVLGQYDELSQKLRLPLYTWFTPLMRGVIALTVGELDDAERYLQEANEQGTAAQDPNVAPFMSAGYFVLATYRDTVHELADQVRGRTRNMWDTSSLPFLSLLTGDREAARSALESQVRDGFSEVRVEWYRLWNLADFSLTAAELGHITAATQLYEMLLPFRDHYVMGYVTVRTSASYLLGVLASTLKRFEEAEAHFEMALLMARRMRMRPHEAEIKHRWAEMLRRRRRDTDLGRARQMEVNALELAQEVGMTGLVKQLVGAKVPTQKELLGPSGGSLHAVADAVEEERPDLAIAASPDGTVTLMFSDIESSTALNESLGDERWFAVLRMHNDIVRKHIASHRGYEVKSNGDGFMIAFPSARLGLNAAIAIQKALEEHNRTAEVPLRVRMGMHTGEAVRQADDFFGRHVNLAARVASEAAGGQILVSSLTRALVAGASFEFGPDREAMLKGFTEPQRFAELIWQKD